MDEITEWVLKNQIGNLYIDLGYAHITKAVVKRQIPV